MSDADKWNRIHGAAQGGAPRAAPVLAEYEHLLPATGDALDLACGRGGNALLLAARGLDTAAWDISEVALESLRKTAAGAGLRVHAECRDVAQRPPEPGSRDVIVVSHFLDRALAPHLVAALRRGGLLYYQTFVRDAVNAEGPTNSEYRLQPNELLEMFRPLRIVAFREEGTIGDIRRGLRNQAMLVAQRSR